MAPGHHAGPQDEEVFHIGGETLVEPEQLRGILAAVVEGPQGRVVEPLHVPGVEELVGHELEEGIVAFGLVEALTVGDEAGAVPVFKPAPQSRREGVEEEVALEREAAEDRTGGLHDPVGGLLDPVLVAVVRSREGQFEPGAALLEGAEAERAQFEGGVHQGVEVRRQVGTLGLGKR